MTSDTGTDDVELVPGWEAPEQFLKEIEQSGALPAQVSAADAAMAAVCTLTAHLTAGEARDLVDGLPPTARALLQRCKRHQREPGFAFGREEFLHRVAEHLSIDTTDAERVAMAVFSAVRARLPAKEVDDVASQLPKELRQIWRGAPAPAQPEPSGAPIYHPLIQELEHSGALPEHVVAPAAFAAVMCILTQRVSGGEAMDVLLSLPASIRPLIERCVIHRIDPGGVFDRSEFIRRVAQHLDTTAAEAENIARAVFAVTQHAIPGKEVGDVAGQLPAD